MRISELAGQTGTTTKTLRFYEDAGLLAAPSRSENGYRMYDAVAISKVRFIKAGQAVGLTLAEIRNLLVIRYDGRAPCSAAIDLLDARIAEITERIRDLQEMKLDLTKLRDRAGDLDPRECTPESVCHVINPVPCDCEAHQRV